MSTEILTNFDTQNGTKEEICWSKTAVTFLRGYQKQIPFSLYTPRLERDPLQSLSNFYNVVKKLEHFQNLIFCPIMRRKRAHQVKFDFEV